MSFGKSWDANRPAGSEEVAEGDNIIVNMKEAVRERLSKDHVFELVNVDDDATCGKHKAGFITATSGYLGSKCLQESNYGDASIPASALKPDVNQAPFRGALVSGTDGTITLASGGQLYGIAIANVTFDTSSFFSTVSPNNKLFTIPSGVSYVRLSCNLWFSLDVAGTKLVILSISRDGATYGYVSCSLTGVGTEMFYISTHTPVIPVTPGQQFRPVLNRSAGDTGLLTLGGIQYGIEVIR